MEIFDSFLSFFRKKVNRIPIDTQYTYPKNIDQRFTSVLTDDVIFNPVSPDKEFDFQKYSDAVVSIVNGSEPKFSIGIYGEWGSGKTTLMRMIERKLTPEKFEWNDLIDNKIKSDSIKKYLKTSFQIDWITKGNVIAKLENNKTLSFIDTDTSKELTIDLCQDRMKAPLRFDGKLIYEFLIRKNKKNDLILCESNVLTVWFNAWRYENEKEFALIPLMKTIAYTIGDHPVYKDLKPLILKALAIIGKDALRFYALKYFMTEKGLKEFENNLRNKFADSEEFDREALYFEGIKKIEQKMLDIMKNEQFKSSRIVIFVDDLDRCSPEKTLEVFESIKVFLDIKGFIFILGLSREALDKLIVAKFEKMGLKDISGEEYIRKIIQVEIQIGKWEKTSIGLLIDEISKDLDDNYRNAVKNSKDLLKEVVESNPRQTKRFINNLIIALTANPNLDYNTFLCVEALQRRWKNFYNNLSNTIFLKEIKSGLNLSDDNRLAYINDLDEKQKNGKLPFEFIDILGDLRICYLDKELWTFLARFGNPILEKIKPSEEPTTDTEVEVAKTLEIYKKAREATNIPIPNEFENIIYIRDYYEKVLERVNHCINSLKLLMSKDPNSRDMKSNLNALNRGVDSILDYMKRRIVPASAEKSTFFQIDDRLRDFFIEFDEMLLLRPHSLLGKTQRPRLMRRLKTMEDISLELTKLIRDINRRYIHGSEDGAFSY